MSEFAWFVVGALGIFAMGVVTGIAIAAIPDDDEHERVLFDVSKEPPSNVRFLLTERDDDGFWKNARPYGWEGEGDA